MATVTSKEFNQRPSQVKRTAENGPVVITEHDRPSFVLMTYAEYQRLHRTPGDLSEWLKMTDLDDGDIEFEVEPIARWIESVEP